MDAGHQRVLQGPLKKKKYSKSDSMRSGELIAKTPWWYSVMALEMAGEIQSRKSKVMHFGGKKSALALHIE